MLITLESIKARQTEITEMIAAFEKQPIAPVFPISVPFPALNEGEKFVGVIISADGARRHALILLPGEAEEGDWKTQMQWAESIGGELPDRCEGALLFATLKEEFKPEAYWTREQHAALSNLAWCQYFSHGIQVSYYKSAELRARAVRRLAIQ